MSKPDPPTPPNPYQTAAAQTGTNVSTGVANAFLNNVNQSNFGGTLNYDVTGNYDWTDPSTGSKYSIPRFTATQTPTQSQRDIQNNTQASQYNLSQTGREQSYRIGSLLNTTFDPVNMPWVPQGGNASNIGNVPRAATSYDTGGQIQTGLGNYGQQQSTFGDAGDITRSYGPSDNFSADRQRVEESLYGRLNPQLAKDRTAIEQRLADQGIRYGSQAYTSAMDDYNRQSNDARLAVTAQGGQEQARMNDMAAKQAGFQNAAQMQAYQQAQGRGEFANAAQQQNYNQALGAGSFANAAQQQQNSQNAAQAGFGNAGLAQQLAQQQSVFNASNSARNQAMQEQYAQRNQPLNEISALMSGSQVSQTPWLNTPNSQIATTDIGGLINQNFAQQQQNYQTANSNWQSMMGGLLGLGGKLATMSDERVKENIVPMGTVFAAGSDGKRKQLPISEWSYKGDPARHVGPMAQDVEKIDKRAITTRDGIKHIYPAKVMGSILRAA
jgi:Chaperone of endosialidase